MARKNENKGTMAFADTIRHYLEKESQNEAFFSVKFPNPPKTGGGGGPQNKKEEKKKGEEN